MSATIGSLVDRLHEIAFTMLGDPPEQPTGPAVQRHVAGWAKLSQALERTLAFLPYSTLGAQRSSVLSGHLARPGAWPTTEAPAHEQLAAMAQCVGAIGDVLVGYPAPFRREKTPRRPAFDSPVWGQRPDDDRGATLLQRSILAAVYAAARRSEQLFASCPEGQPYLDDVGRTVLATEPYASMAPRSGPLDHVAVPSPTGPGLDPALLRWKVAIGPELQRHSLSTNACETVAADLTILAGAVYVGVRALAVQGGVASTLLQEQAQAANRAWKSLATWPATLHIAGRRSSELREASRDVRREVSALMRDGQRWTPPEKLAESLSPTRLERTLTSLAATSRWAGHALATGLNDSIRGQDRLWVRKDEAELRFGRREGFTVTHPLTGREVSIERNWIIYPVAVEAALELGRSATDAAGASARVEHSLRDHLAAVPSGGQFEGVSPAVRMERGRIHALGVAGPGRRIGLR